MVINLKIWSKNCDYNDISIGNSMHKGLVSNFEETEKKHENANRLYSTKFQAYMGMIEVNELFPVCIFFSYVFF